MDNISLITIIVTTANTFMAIVSATLLMLVFWQNPRGRVNQVFSLTMLILTAYSVGNILGRYIDEFNLDPKSVFYITIGLYALFVGLLFLFVVLFANLARYRAYRLALIASLFLSVLFIFLLLDGYIITDIRRADDNSGNYITSFSTIGYAAAFITILYPLTTTSVLYRLSKKQARLNSLWIAPALVVFGMIWTVSGWLLIPLPLNAFTLATAVFILGQAILRENLFYPLADLNRSLAEKNRQLDEANQLKNQFLANMSHELRTPLNSIINFAELMLDGIYGEINDQQANRLERVARNGRNLLSLVNDILDLNRIESGRIELHPTPVSAPELLDSVIAIFEPQIATKKLVVLREYADNVPKMLVDFLRGKQVFTNLLSNAVKFTHQGHLRIRILHQEPMVRVAIEDTGIGIPVDKQQAVFDAFQQADNTTTREYGGTGLGLNITKRLVEMSGGQLTMHSTVGTGTTFFVDLPCADPIVQALPKEPLREFDSNRPLKVLIIDDNHDARVLLQDTFKKDQHHRWQVFAAASGQEGLFQANAIRPNVITLDVMMPGMDGWQVLRQLKNSPALFQIPVIIVSVVDNQALATQMGAYALIAKPLNAHRLLEVLNELFVSS